MPNPLPFSQACENNKQPILDQLVQVFVRPGTILEIGSGTGQHAVHFASGLPHVIWQPSDHPAAAELCLPRVKAAALPNLRQPLALDVAVEPWPIERMDGVFTANTAHIMAWPEVVQMFQGIGARIAAGSAFCQYGPFMYEGQHTSPSNARFDEHLRAQASHIGLRDMESMVQVAGDSGLELVSDVAMPANNRLLVWRKR